MWVSLAFLAVVVIAVVAFRLGHMTARRSSLAIDTMVDQNHDGRIDPLEPSNLPQNDFERRELARRTFQQLKQLEKMKSDGMITSAEYSAKRTELLRET